VTGPGRDAPKATTVEVRKAGFQVYRRVGTESYRLPLAQEPLAEQRTTDTTAPQGASACYVVRAAASVDPLVESAPSNEACVEVRDIEPPAAPAGTAVLPRERGLEVLWTPSPEDDIAGYRVYREAPGEPRGRVAEVEAARSAWLDTRARPGVVYQYDVTAFDRAGNESPKAKAVEASLP
jgi:fibronectin type 3 domain-containing protein